jgi:hypothetical protein
MRAGALSRQFSLARGWPLFELSTNQNEAVLNLARSPDRSSELLGNCIDDDEFLVRWRDDQNEPRASRSREYIALLHSKLTGL